MDPFFQKVFCENDCVSDEVSLANAALKKMASDITTSRETKVIGLRNANEVILFSVIRAHFSQFTCLISMKY